MQVRNQRQAKLMQAEVNDWVSKRGRAFMAPGGWVPSLAEPISCLWEDMLWQLLFLICSGAH